MGLKDDLERFRAVGERRRQDLAEFISQGDLAPSGQNQIRIPIKIVDLPAFEYDRLDQGGVGKGDADVGDPVDADPQPGDDEEGDPGEEEGDHGYYEMNPEEFARELDERLGLDLEPKGKKVIEETEGDFTEMARSGPRSALDVEHFFREGLKRKLATDFDEGYVMEALRVAGWGPNRVYEWARANNLPVSKGWIEDAYEEIDDFDRWETIGEMEASVEHTPTAQRVRQKGLRRLPFRREDERYRHPEVVEREEKNVVVVNIRDVSGSMREKKRELIERVFTPMDWYLQGKYDNAAFRYIAHDAEAWEVDRADFFGIRSGGGTKISSAYELAADLLEEYPYSEWNRYVFAAGDSENSTNDTGERVIPLMEEISANMHAYIETRPEGSGVNATHAEELQAHFGNDGNVAVARVSGAADVIDAISEILHTEEAE
jgi:uncharacterized sporulation protein YeaH/YhbH (DUF444 family)